MTRKTKTKTANKTSLAVKKLDHHIRAQYPLIVIASYDEARVTDAIAYVAENPGGEDKQPKSVFEWTFSQGLRHVAGPELKHILPAASETTDPGAALRTLLEWSHHDNPAPTLFVFKDLHAFLGNGAEAPARDVVRLLRDIAWVFQAQPMTLIIVSPQFNVPPDLEKDVVLLDWPLPTPEELMAILTQIANEIKTQEVTVNLGNGAQEQIVSALQGLTANEAANVLSMSVITNGKLDESAILIILAEKKQIIKRTGYLEFWEADITAKDIGGLKTLKEYTALKRALFSAEAEAYGTDRPKGYLMVGVPGSGKSLTAKATTGGIMPLLRLNIAALMGGPVGQSESDLHHALRLAEAASPCVLWIDEIEKAIATDGGELASGASKRMLGEILTWMEEHTAPVYVVATANRAEILQSELLSRFDDIWFVDLPAVAEREEIIRIHLAKRGRNPEDFDISAVVEATEGYVGREIEKIVKTALNLGFVDGSRPITTDDLLYAAKRVMPISKVKPEEIEAMRKWGAKYALNASGDGDESAEATTTKRARKLEL